MDVNKRIEELKHIKKQIQALENLSKIDDSLLSNEQRELIEHGNVLFEMIEKSKYCTACGGELIKTFEGKDTNR